MDFTKEEAGIFQELDLKLQRGHLLGGDLTEAFSVYSDVYFPPLPPLQRPDKLIALYCEGMVDKSELNLYFTRVCHYINQTLAQQQYMHKPSEELPIFELQHTMKELTASIFSGKLVVYREGKNDFWSIDISNIPQRSVEESNTEISIKGPRDAFNESLTTNTSLIRKRLQTELLHSEKFTVGTLSKTEISLLYLVHKANPTIIDEVRTRLNEIEIETVVSSGQLEQYLSDRTFSLFPLIDYIGRPDFVVETLLRGRFAIVVNGSPMVLIGPSNFFELLKSPEDVHFPYYIVILQRLLRVVGLLLSIFLPGFWVAIVSVNVDQIPYTLLSTVIISREGIPFPTFLESLLLLFLFELLREAGVRLPKSVGQTVGIVGGLIIGESLIRAGLASPTLLVIIAVSVVSTFSLVNQSLAGTVSLFRFLILVVSSFLGIYGFFLSLFVILIYLCKLQSFGIAYLEPVVSLKPKDTMAALILNPFRKSRSSSDMLNKRKRERN